MGTWRNMAEHILQNIQLNDTDASTHTLFISPLIKHEQKYQKTNSCLLGNNTKVFENDKADVNNQMSRKYKEENIRSYLKGFSSLVALMPTLRAGFSYLIYRDSKKQS